MPDSSSAIHIDISPHGFHTLHIGARRIHSIHNPIREAENFAKAIPKSRLIILLGASIGYLCTAIKKQHPNSLLIGVYLHRTIYDNTNDLAHLHWHPDTNTKENITQSLQGFLFKNLPEDMLATIQIAEWKPMLDSFPEMVSVIRTAIQNVVERMRKNLFTTAYFGRRWIRNTVANYLRCNTQLPFPTRQSKPVVITAPGWSIQENLPFIAENRSKILLCTLSSALSILNAHKIQPDYIVHSDGGYWAARYLTGAGRSIPVLSALHARLPASVAQVIFFSQGYNIEHDIATSAGFPCIQDTASVAGAALELALRITTALVLFVGLDLCPRDIISHGRPHLSERILNLKTHRLFPEELARFSVIAGSTSALKHYADWFREYLAQDTPVPIARLASHPAGAELAIPVLAQKDALAYMSSADHTAGSTPPPRPAVEKAPSLTQRKTLVRSILLREEETLRNGGRSLVQTVSPLALQRYIQNGEKEADWRLIKDNVGAFISELRSKYID